ncbi:hypothetical protein POM88_037658 [Heracleum sosnowskyi]|uniref:Uncharacterized protein n=1 Tax=Heracleum sosnowskyi TaxID=360622 RepID=A0AAD8MFI9_9APIA|nr:hypothetical protein POM88_037658 [Heracleum sosnowskyi]
MLAEGLDGLDELVSGGKKSHGPGWLIGRHDVKCVKSSTQNTAPTDSYIQELTKKLRQEVVEEVEAKLNQKVSEEVDAKVNPKVQDNLTLVLKKLVDANPSLNINIGEQSPFFAPSKGPPAIVSVTHRASLSSVFLVLENGRHLSQDQNDYPRPMGLHPSLNVVGYC